MGNTRTRSLNYWQCTFCRQPKVQCSESFGAGCRFHSTGVRHLFGSCKKFANLPDLPSCYEYVSPQKLLKSLSVRFCRKRPSYVSGTVLGGSSPQSSRRMSSCGQGWQEGPTGMRASSCRAEAEKGHWKGRRRNNDTGRL